MFKIIFLAAGMILGFGSLGVLGIAVVYVLQRWYLMLRLQIDWDDTGVLIAAKARKRHGAHQIGELREQSAAMTRADRLLGMVRPVVRVQAEPVPDPVTIARTAQRLQVTGKPPWPVADYPTTLVQPRRPATADPDATLTVRRIDDAR